MKTDSALATAPVQRPKIFLTAEWRQLAMLNYAVDPAVLRPLVPRGTELDFHHGQTFVSVVGFRFLNTRVLGFFLPHHRDFEEVNLRFYVRRQVAGEWRRGVVFVSELVPRHLIAFVARTFYGEPYRVLPMRHAIEQSGPNRRVEYSWQRSQRWEHLRLSATGESQEMAAGSEEEFITEHYWGYTARGDRTSEYQVEHPRWRFWRATEALFEADVQSLYGAAFVEALSRPPTSAFIAEGSSVSVRRGCEV